MKIPDFYCFERKVIIEVDGNIHNLDEIYSLDLYKEELLKKLWFKILRITNNEIKLDIKKVLIKIIYNFSLFQREYPKYEGEGLEYKYK